VAFKKSYISFLIAVLLFTGLAAGFHHHEDNLIHDDCAVCIAAAQSPSIAWDNAPQVKGPNVFAETICLSGIPAESAPFLANLKVRSPPALS
jgi:hypothetical protein